MHCAVFGSPASAAALSPKPQTFLLGAARALAERRAKRAERACEPEHAQKGCGERSGGRRGRGVYCLALRCAVFGGAAGRLLP